ncbi:MAG: histidine ammonia-lyase [Bacillota bacterium]
MEGVELSGHRLTLSQLAAIAIERIPVHLAAEARERVERGRQLVDKLVDEEQVVYGITTGFGKFSDVPISRSDTRQLQHNLIVSHACGVGEPLSEAEARAALALRVNALAQGHSGVRVEVMDLMVGMLNRGVHPVIPGQGSLGASGDLAPLAHMVLVMLGLGEAFYQGERISGAQALSRAGLAPIALEAKEGLALINGTQIMTAIGALAFWRVEHLARAADCIASLTVQALRGIPKAYDPRIHALRPHRGQQRIAANLRMLLAGSQATTEPGQIRVQDPYTLRCLPQVHGASRDALDYVRETLATEINAVTDNPLLFPEDGEVISGGNFHGQPVALAMDLLGIAAAELANISERRIERLVNPQLSGLPAFLTREGGLNSGFMIAQYSAAALVSENKVLAHPASVDSIPSSANQEDHVSMGTIAARHAREIAANLASVLAIELLCTAQAIDLGVGAEALSPATRAAYDLLRQAVPTLRADRVISDDIVAARRVMEGGEFLPAVEGITGRL